jgi:hypothetical protein
LFWLSQSSLHRGWSCLNRFEACQSTRTQNVTTNTHGRVMSALLARATTRPQTIGSLELF